MANQISGLAGYNFRLDGVLLNSAPVVGDFPVTGLDADTVYGSRLTVSAVDKAGNESAAVPFGPTAKTLSSTPEQELMSAADRAAIDTIVARCMAAGAGPGVTIAITSPRGYYINSYGSGTGNDLNYRVASQTKTFLTWVFMMMVEQGLMSLDDHLSDHLPGYAVDPTLRQMFQMRSGLYDPQSDTSLAMQMYMNPAMSMTVDQWIDKIKAGTSGRTDKSEFSPGEKYYYTNSNYFLLAKIIESVDPAHRTIDQMISEEVLTPLGLVNTVFPTTTGLPPAPYSKGYAKNLILSFIGIIQKVDVSKQNPAFVWASGAITSVIGDMVKWGAEMRDCTLLSPASYATIKSSFEPVPVPESGRYGLNHTGPPEFGYGLGFLQCGSWFGHDGSWIGYDSCTMFEPHTGTVISVYENFQTTAPNPLASFTTVWYEIADYLYPGSPAYPGYASGDSTTGAVSGALKKLSTDATGALYPPGVLPAQFDNASAIGTTSTAIPAFNISADATALVAWMSVQGTDNMSTVTATIDGQTMDKTVIPTSNSNYKLVCFTLLNPPTGNGKSITINNAPGPAHYYATGAASYKNVDAFGPVVYATNTSEIGQVVASATDLEMIAAGFFYSSTLDSFNRTLRGRKNIQAFLNQGLVFGDAHGAENVAFTVDLGGSAPWAGAAIPLLVAGG